MPEGKTPTTWLRRLTEDGMRRRWPQGVPPRVVRLVEHELALIKDLQYEAYFLTVYDIVAYARSEGILCRREETLLPIFDLGHGQPMLAGRLLGRRFALQNAEHQSRSALRRPSLDLLR